MGTVKAMRRQGRAWASAAEAGLGTLVMTVATWDAVETWGRLDRIFEDWAAASKHPEIRGAAILTAGLSASTILMRNLAYVAPDRVFAVLHAAGGNLHEGIPTGKTLSGVPFMAANGEYESCGPEGGIRPHLGFDTQWYLMGDTMLARRKLDPNHLMSLVVVPGKGHTAWNQELGALFMRKAAQYRLPKEKRDGSTPTQCVPLRAEDGWLTDRNVKYPEYEPAAYADYKGDKSQAFWHLDEETARAVCTYHKDGIRPGQEHSIFRPAGLFERLWPLGERMDIPFKGHSPEEHAAAVREWIVKKTGMPSDTPALGNLVAGVANGIVLDKDGNVDEAAFRKRCLRICYAYDDLYRPVEESIEKANLSGDSKNLLCAHYSELLLVLWPDGKKMPDLPLRAIQARIAGIPTGEASSAMEAWLKEGGPSGRAVLDKLYGPAPSPRPEPLDRLLADVKSGDSKIGWAAAEEMGKLGAAAISDLVYLMDFGGPPADFRAAAALGAMGKAAAPALPDLRRSTLRGGTTENDGLLSRKALEAVDKVAAKDAQP